MRIALLEDDADQADVLIKTLTAGGHNCHGFSQGQALIRALRRETFDLLALDWVVPDMSGEQVLRWVREIMADPVPVIFITSHARDIDISSILDAGADDYVVQPVPPGVLLSRVSSLLRRAYQRDPSATRETYGYFQFNGASTQLLRKDVAVPLTKREFALALLLFQNLGRPLSHAHILERVWRRADDIDSRTLAVHIANLRAKLDLRPENGYRLASIYGYGYRLEQIDAPGIEAQARHATSTVP